MARRADADPGPGIAPDLDRLRSVGLAAGLAAVGATTAEVLEPARSLLELRRAAGLAGSMQFTYRNPERSTDPGRIVPGARSLVVGLYDYRRADRRSPPGLPGRVARYSWRDSYRELRAGLSAIADELRSAGYRATIVADSNALVDRNAAWRAGLGWYGKNTNILAPGTGSWYVVGAVVTDAEIAPAGEPLPDGCGSCSACVDHCPTGALVAPGVLDARRCLAWLVQAAEPIPVEHRAAVGDWLYGCDICQEVCPPNKVTIRRVPPAEREPDAEPFVDIGWVLDADDDELLARCGRWYIADRDPDVIRRTALVVLGNIGDGGDPTAIRLVGHYLDHPNPLLRAHAVWAARRLGLDHLAEATKTDPETMVRAEWSHPVDRRSGADER